METLLPGIAVLNGNMHPLLIHFPIAFFLGALAMEGLAVLHHEKFHLVATWMLYLGTLMAIITLPTGFIAANMVAAQDPRGHDAPGHQVIHYHRNFMMAATLLGILLSMYVFLINQKGKWRSHRFGLLFGLVVLSVLVALGADRGARLVFEFGTGINPNVITKSHDNADAKMPHSH
jgi:uncharacterized membrane protein